MTEVTEGFFFGRRRRGEGIRNLTETSGGIPPWPKPPAPARPSRRSSSPANFPIAPGPPPGHHADDGGLERQTAPAGKHTKPGPESTTIAAMRASSKIVVALLASLLLSVVAPDCATVTGIVTGPVVMPVS